MGYPSCGYRTFTVGRKPTQQEKDWYKRVKETIYSAIEVTRPGKTTADAAKFFPPATKWGYQDEVEVLTVEFGHGLGMVLSHAMNVPYAWPNIDREWSLKHPQPFEKGMVIAYEILGGEHRVGGVRLEHMVVVTDGEPEILDHFPAEDIIEVG